MKFKQIRHDSSTKGSHPTWVRGLKFDRSNTSVMNLASHPTWVRGLKFVDGQVDSTAFLVAPHVGAWIEIVVMERNRRSGKSHPTWVRGLKSLVLLLFKFSIGSHPTWVRGLKSLLWNAIAAQARSHPTWVRGLKCGRLRESPLFPCRTPRGCVD